MVATPSRKKAPGYSTSEFVIAILVLVAATLLRLTHDIDAEAWKWAVSGATVGYSLSRGIAKFSD